MRAAQKFHFSYTVVMLTAAILAGLYWRIVNVAVSKLDKATMPMPTGPTVETHGSLEPMPSIIGKPPSSTVANPPYKALTSQPKMDLLFKDSPLLNQSTKERIRQDLTRFRDYFVSLHIEVPAESSAIGVEIGRIGVTYVGSGEVFALGQNASIPPTTIPTPIEPLPSYRQNIMIGEKSLNERTAITLAYSNHVLGELLKNRKSQHPNISSLQDMMAIGCLSAYFNWSFWGSKPEKDGGYWTGQLWQLRERFGKDFTDKLLSFTFRAITDTPEENASPDFDIYFYNKLKIADSVIDNDSSKMPAITDIIEGSGLSVRKPKAILTFDASVAWKVSGILSIVINVINDSDLDATNGQLRTNFQPDPKIITTPEGCSTDPSTTLKSARILAFDSIPAHSKEALRFEVVPIPLKVFPMLLVNINYQCQTCVKDCYSHYKKFDLSKIR